MKNKDFGLLVALGVLIFMAVYSEKKILVAEGYAFTRLELDQGRHVYEVYCGNCHDRGLGKAPRISHPEEWEIRLTQNLALLIAHAVEGFQGDSGWMPAKGGASSLTADEVGLAVAYMVQMVGVESGEEWNE